MGITLNNAIAAALPYAPYVAAGVAAIAALAAIYFYIQSRNAASSETPLPPPLSPPVARKTPPATQPSPSPVGSQDNSALKKTYAKVLSELQPAIEKRARESQQTQVILEKQTQVILETFNAAADEAAKATQIQQAPPLLSKALQTALGSASTSQQLAALTEAFVRRAYDVFSKTTGRSHEQLDRHHLFQNFLKGGFRAIWKHPAARADTLLPAIPENFVSTFKDEGKSALKPKFLACEDLEEMRGLANNLKALGFEGDLDAPCKELEIKQLRERFDSFGISLEVKQGIISQLTNLGDTVDDLHKKLAALAMTERNYSIQTRYPEALKLHDNLCKILGQPVITVSAIDSKVPPDLFSAELVAEIKNQPSDAHKNEKIHSATGQIATAYKEALSFGPVYDAFLALTAEIDKQTTLLSFDLSKRGEMDRLIRATLWLDLLSLGANMGHRDLKTEMDDSRTAAAIAAAQQ